MERQYYIDLAAKGLRMPIGTDLVLHEHADHADIVLAGERLGAVIAESADKYRTPLAVGLMDLMLEKTAMLRMLGIAAADIPTYHFSQWVGDSALDKMDGPGAAPLPREMQAHVDAVAWVARHRADLVPTGMVIGPFSLMTKLLKDPITPVYMAGTGVGPDEDDEVELVEKTLELAARVVLRSVEAQLRAGAKIIVVAEPAANKVYFSPTQLEKDMAVFDRYVMRHNRAIRQKLDDHGADLFFHCCGELVPAIVSRFNTLDPAIMSLGSSRKLWEDSPLVDKKTVLFGNLPSKNFYSDQVISLADVERLSCEVVRNMRDAGHPHILGSECDVLSVPGREAAILAKVDAFLNSPA